MASNMTAPPGAPTDSDPVWDPDDDEFVEHVVIDGLAVFIIGLLVLLAFFIYYMVRCVCWTCLGDECCDKRNKVRASPRMVTINNWIVAVLLIGCMAGGAWLLYAGAPIIDSLDSLTNTMVTEAETFKNSANSTISIVEEAVPDGSDIDLSELTNARDLLADAQKDLEDAEDSVRDATDAFHGVIVTFGVLAIVLAILGLLCIWIRSIVFLYLYFIIATVVVFGLWTLAGLGVVGNGAFAETCEMMKAHAAGNRNQYVLDKLPCEDLSKAGDAVSEAQVAGNRLVQDANEDITQLNSVVGGFLPTFDPLPLLCEPYLETPPASGQYEPNANATGCTPLEEPRLVAAYGDRVCQRNLPPDADPASNQQYQQCILADDQPITNQTYTELLNSANSIQQLNQQLPTIRDIADCGFIDTAFERIVDDNCDDLKDDSNRLATAALISAITLTLTSFYFCICIQNIRKQDAPRNSEGQYLTSEGEPVPQKLP